MSPLPSKIYNLSQQNTPQKNTEDNLYEVQTKKSTKTLNKTDTIRPIATAGCPRYFLGGQTLFVLVLFKEPSKGKDSHPV